MKCLNPIPDIGEHEFAHRPAVRAVEIDRLAPFVLITIGEIALRKAFQVIAVRTEVVVDNVENDREAERMRAVDKGAEIVGPAIKTRRREQIDAVISPTEASGKIGDRHEFEAGDAELRERR